MAPSNDMLLGELKAFREHTVQELIEIKAEIKSLSNYKWKVTGFLICAIFLFETYVRLR